MNLLWFSNAPWCKTGYGNQTNLFWWRIQRMGHRVTLAANYGCQGSVLGVAHEYEGTDENGEPQTMREETQVLPQGYQGNSLDIIAAHAQHVHADATISLFDSWVFPGDVMSKLQGWIAWAPVDHDPLPEQVASALRVAYQPIAYSQFGLRKMEEYVFPDGQRLEPRYIPHGIDTTLFAPKDKDASRAGLSIPELEGVEFLAVMVAANKGFPSRKAFPEVMAAWKIFVERHPKSLLFLHTQAGDLMRGCHLPNLLTALGVKSGSVVFADQYWAGPMGYPAGAMAQVYSAADVLLNPSYGEGFGLPIVEAQACGTPVIVNDCTSMPELCFSGWATGNQGFYTGLESWQFIPKVDDIVESLELAYQARGSETLQARAREGALAYDADTVAKTYWEPFLAELEGELLAGRVEGEADPLQEAKGK